MNSSLKSNSSTVSPEKVLRVPRATSRARRVWLRRARNASALLGMVVVLVTFTPFVPWWARQLAQPRSAARGDVLIVLGTSHWNGIVTESLYQRCVYAVRAWRSGGFTSMVLLGGTANRSVSPSAVSMAHFLQSQGVPASAIHIETNSTSTRESALQAVPILATLPGRKVLMTSDFQMLRTYRTFQNAGIDVVAAPIPDVMQRDFKGRWSGFVDLLDETAKIIYYYARGWM